MSRRMMEEQQQAMAIIEQMEYTADLYSRYGTPSFDHFGHFDV